MNDRVSRVRIIVEASRTPLVERTVRILERVLKERAGVTVVEADRDSNVALAIEPGIGREGYRIEATPAGAVRVVGHDERGLLYGVGKLLRTSRYHEGAVSLSSWRGVSVPRRAVRGIYFATHFFNFYHVAPIEQVVAYIEDLALWGTNGIWVWFDMHHYRGLGDPLAKPMLERLRAILRAAKGVGMGAGIVGIANEAYAESSPALRATPCTWSFGVELCPSKPEGLRQLLDWRQEVFDAFADLDIEWLDFGPYDQGGCACEACAPWGCNGYLKLCEQISRRARHTFPRARYGVMAWCFDRWTTGEYAGLWRMLAARPDWVDFLLVDTNGKNGQYLLDHGAPGGVALLNFPEISMRNMNPWGGFGANPMPATLQRDWDVYGRLLQGGFAYSEGLYEDLNKAIISQLYWDPDKPTVETVREYAAAEFDPAVADDLVEAVTVMEACQDHKLAGAVTNQLWKPDAASALDLTRDVLYELPKVVDPERYVGPIRRADAVLSPRARQRWRWRLLWLRAALDEELHQSGGRATEAADRYFEDVNAISATHGAIYALTPPSRQALKRLTGRA